MPTGLIVFLALLSLTLLLALPLLGAYLYFRGVSRTSPLAFIPAKTPEPAKPAAPTAPCPACKVAKWQLSPDESKWTCEDCGRAIVGPKPRIRS